jgi:glycolate oxidase
MTAEPGSGGDPTWPGSARSRLDEGALECTTAREVAESEALLAARRCSLPALAGLGPMAILEDATDCHDRGWPRWWRGSTRLPKRHDVVIGTFGHAGDGNLHPTCVLHPDDTDAIERACTRRSGEIFRAAMELGSGTISGEHGIGASKLPYLVERLRAGPAGRPAPRRVKTALRPRPGSSNPGKLGS